MAKDHWSFDRSRSARARNIQRAAEELAESAARKVAEYREAFASVHKAAQYLAAEASKSRFLAELASYPATRDWEKEVQARAGTLSRDLPDISAFRAAVSRVIDHSRELHKLPKHDAIIYED